MLYFDYNATTPVDPRVLDKMLPYFNIHFGNPSSSHTWGWTAQAAVKNARNQVANLIKCNANEVYFTASATESNNWVIEGLIKRLRKNSPSEKIHIITSNAEHNSILQTLKEISQDKVNYSDLEITFLPVNSDGIITTEQVESAITPNTKLISLIWVNNEIGTINPVDEVGIIARKHQIYFHTDATQAVGKIDINLEKTPVDLISFSGHKIYGPKGVGVLFCKSNHPHVSIDPIILGGGQEGGQRSGTLNVPGIVGIGEACEIINQNFEQETSHLKDIQAFLLNSILNENLEIKVNGSLEKRSPSNLNLCLKGKNISMLSGKLIKIAYSTGSACNSSHLKGGSHVLNALGLSQEDINSSMRISWGRMTTLNEAKELVEIIKSVISQNNAEKLAQIK